jgi:cytochrome c peroxidase
MKAFGTSILLSLLTSAVVVDAAQLTVELKPRWQADALKLDEVKWQTAAGDQLSVTRLAMLLSHAELQRADKSWIGARDWVALIDLNRNRLSFDLTGIPAERYTALRFDIGLDEATDRRPAAQWPAEHPLNPEVSRLHWSWRGENIFFAIEGRYQQRDQKLGGYSYHLAGQPCRGTVVVPVELDLRRPLKLTLGFQADQVFTGAHAISIKDEDSTHSGEDGGLAEHLADNLIQGFRIISLMPTVIAPQANEPAPDTSWLPALLRSVVPAHFPPTPFPQDNPLTADGVALGRTLFNDKRLSQDNTQACATCHLENLAFTDGQRFSIGIKGNPGRRNAMPLTNLAWKTSFFWDGRAPSLRQQVLQPIQDPTEMHETLEHVITKLDDLAPHFEKAFGTPQITADRLARALEQYLLTLVSSESKMDRTLTHSEPLTEQEQRGMTLFFTESDPGRGVRGADCFHCHGGVHFTNQQFINNGLDADTQRTDHGLSEVTHQDSDKGKFIVPSLRNVALTAPYMHDGRFSTLEQVIEHYNSGIQRSNTLDPNLAKHLRYNGLSLTPQEKSDLLAFLKTLTDKFSSTTNGHE